MRQNQFLLGLRSASDLAGEAYSTPPVPLTGFKGPYTGYHYQDSRDH